MPRRTPKWTAAPLVPTTSPWATNWSAWTSIVARKAYDVRSPSAWRTVTKRWPPMAPAKVTTPAALARTGVPGGTA